VKQTIQAVYEDGVFRPAAAPDVADGQTVTLVVETEAAGPSAALALAARVYEGLSCDEIEAIEHIAFDRRSFFRET